MEGKTYYGKFPVTELYSDGWTSTRYIYARQMYNFSGWGLIRGNHKNPNPHGYTSLKAGGVGRIRTSNGYGRTSSLLTGAANPGGYQTSVSSFAYDTALSKLYGKIRGDLDLSIDAFQARQTARGFKAGELITNFVKEVDRKPWYITSLQRYFGPISRLAGSARLAWVYGWKPLIDDYYAVLDESLRDYINHFQTFKGKSRGQSDGYCFGNVDWDGIYRSPTFYKTLTDESVQISVTLDTTKLPEMAYWTSMNPASIAWELMPYSFVIDWFINIGGALRNLETALLFNQSFHSGYITYFLRVTGESGGYQQKGLSCEGSYWFTYVSMNRRVLTRLPLPNAPSFRPKLGADRILNGLALITGLKPPRSKRR